MQVHFPALHVPCEEQEIAMHGSAVLVLDQQVPDAGSVHMPLDCGTHGPTLGTTFPHDPPHFHFLLVGVVSHGKAGDAPSGRVPSFEFWGGRASGPWALHPDAHEVTLPRWDPAQ